MFQNKIILQVTHVKRLSHEAIYHISTSFIKLCLHEEGFVKEVPQDEVMEPVISPLWNEIQMVQAMTVTFVNYKIVNDINNNI
jgi:hypothetical protein